MRSVSAQPRCQAGRTRLCSCPPPWHGRGSQESRASAAEAPLPLVVPPGSPIVGRDDQGRRVRRRRRLLAPSVGQPTDGTPPRLQGQASPVVWLSRWDKTRSPPASAGSAAAERARAAATRPCDAAASRRQAGRHGWRGPITIAQRGRPEPDGSALAGVGDEVRDVPVGQAGHGVRGAVVDADAVAVDERGAGERRRWARRRPARRAPVG